MLEKVDTEVGFITIHNTIEMNPSSLVYLEGDGDLHPSEICSGLWAQGQKEGGRESIALPLIIERKTVCER